MERFKLPLVGFNLAFIVYLLIMASGIVFPPLDWTQFGIQALIGAAIGLVVAGVIYAAVAFAGK